MISIFIEKYEMMDCFIRVLEFIRKELNGICRIEKCNLKK